MSSKHNKPERFWEIDFIRGIAIIMMLIFHTIFDLYFLRITSFNPASFPFIIVAYATASLFIAISGASFMISYCRSRKYLDSRSLYFRYLRRGFVLLAGGAVITLATYLLIGRGYVLYGILHFLGTAAILSPFLSKLGNFKLPFALVSVFIGFVLSFFNGPSFLLPLGIRPVDFISLDYVPIFPWIGVFVAGMAAGEFFYPNGSRRIKAFVNPAKNFLPCKILAFMGKNSLLIYFIHQPAILALIYFFIL